MNSNLIIRRLKNGKYIVFNPNDKTKRDRIKTKKAINALKGRKHEIRNANKRIQETESKDLGQGIKEITSKVRSNKITYTKVVVPKEKEGSDEAIDALFLSRIKGGVIEVNLEKDSNKENEGRKNPDYTINGKDLDLKTYTSTNENTLKQELKRKAEQISVNKGKDGAGGILLNVSKSKLPNHVIKKRAIDALKDTKYGGFDLIVERDKRLIFALRKK